MGIQEEQEVGVTPTRARRSESAGVYTPASSPSELGSILSASDDDSRPVTKREVELLRVQIKGMFSNLRTALNEEAQRRDIVDTLVAGQLEALQSQMPTLNSNLSALNTQLQFQQGALANSRDEADRQRNDMLTTIESLSLTIWILFGRSRGADLSPALATSPIRLMISLVLMPSVRSHTLRIPISRGT